jgi:SET domain-containing protein
MVPEQTQEPNTHSSPVILGPTEHTGLGIFASRAIAQDEVIGEITGTRNSVVNTTAEDVLGHDRWIGMGNNTWIDPQFPFSHINHSCNPNAGIRGMAHMVAMRPIPKGEEITFDYSTTEEDPRWCMRCNCHQSGCRGEIRSIHFLPRETFERYVPYIPNHFQDVYRHYYLLPSVQ